MPSRRNGPKDPVEDYSNPKNLRPILLVTNIPHPEAI